MVDPPTRLDNAGANGRWRPPRGPCPGDYDVPALATEGGSSSRPQTPVTGPGLCDPLGERDLFSVGDDVYVRDLFSVGDDVHVRAPDHIAVATASRTPCTPTRGPWAAGDGRIQDTGWKFLCRAGEAHDAAAAEPSGCGARTAPWSPSADRPGSASVPFVAGPPGECPGRGSRLARLPAVLHATGARATAAGHPAGRDAPFPYLVILLGASMQTGKTRWTHDNYAEMIMRPRGDPDLFKKRNLDDLFRVCKHR